MKCNALRVLNSKVLCIVGFFSLADAAWSLIPFVGLRLLKYCDYDADLASRKGRGVLKFIYLSVSHQGN